MGWRVAVFVWSLSWQIILGFPPFHLSWFFPSDFWAEGLLILISELRDSLSLTKQESLETTALAPDEVVSKFPCRASPVKTIYG